MKISIKYLLYYLVIMIAPFCVNASQDNYLNYKPDRMNVHALNDLETIVNEALEVFEVPGAAIGVVYDGKIIFAKGFGYRNLLSKQPATTETLFAIGSCSKAFTTFVLGTLVDEGLIKWDDPVIKYLPEFKLKDDYATQKITIRDLVTHCSGLPRHDFVWYNSNLTRLELLKRLQHLELTCDLRKQFQYNNFMYMVSGLIIERVTGNSWEEEVTHRIFARLGMTQSNFSVEDSKNSLDFSFPHAKRKEKLQIIPFRNISNMGPAGSINSNVHDMAMWLELQLSTGTIDEKKLIESSTLNEMHTIQFAKGEFPTDRSYFLGYGLGWFIGNYGGYYLVEHGGGIDGFISTVSLLPQEKIGVVVLSNSSDGGGLFVNCIVKSVFDRILGLEPIDWIKKLSNVQTDANQATKENDKQNSLTNTHPSHQLNDFVGDYEHPGYGIIKVRLNKNQLVTTYNNIVIPLEHKHYDTFIGSCETYDPVFANMHFTFHTSCYGDISELNIPFEAKPIIFIKKAPDVLQSPDHLQTYVGQYGDDFCSVDVILRGTELILSTPGQPQYTLIPQNNSAFTIDGLPGYRINFIIDKSGKVEELQSIQPNGIFSLKVKS